jgi:hypothetical protein
VPNGSAAKKRRAARRCALSGRARYTGSACATVVTLS